MINDNILINLIDILKGILTEASIIEDAYIVGGAVRDILIGKPVTDIDLAINRDPYIIASLFARSIKGTYVPLNIKFETARVVKDGYIFDISMLHHGSLEEDVKRRDFTINALAIKLSDNDRQIIDLVDGIRDTNNKIIRMISRDNLIADPLRLIRAFRFMSSLGFHIDNVTLKAVSELKYLIKLPAVERIYTELKILLSSDNAFDALNSMAETGLLTELIPEIKPSEIESRLKIFKEMEAIINNPQGLPYFRQMRQYFSSQPHIKILLKISTLFINDLAQIKGVIERFKVSQKETRYINIITGNICKNNLCPYFYHTKKIDMARFLMRIDGHLYSIFALCLCIVRVLRRQDEDRFMKSASDLFSYYNNEYIPLSKEPHLINGDDLEDIFGLVPSEQFRVILNMVEEKRLCGEISSKDEAVKVVERFLIDN